MPPEPHIPVPKAARLNLLKSLRGADRDFLLYARGNVPFYVAKIKQNVKARQFVELLRTDRIVRRLFFHHWKQLSCLSEISVPVLFGTNAGESEERMVAQSSNLKEREASATIERLFEEALPAIEKEMKRFLRRVEKDAGGEVDETKVMQVVLHWFAGLSGGGPLSGLSRLAKPYEDYFADEAPATAVMLLEASKARVLAYGLARRRDLVRDSGISDVEYEAALKKLFEEGHAVPLGSFVWCSRHEHAPYSYFALGHQTPSIRSGCETCGHKLLCGSFYVLHPSAMMVARHYEGCLPYLMAWDLEQSGYRWNSRVYLAGEPDSEKDLVFLMRRRGKWRGAVAIVECKTYRTDTSERIVRENLKRDLLQLDRQVGSYIARGITVGAAFLSCNYELTVERREYVDSVVKGGRNLPSLRDREFRVLGQDDLSAWLKKPDASVS